MVGEQDFSGIIHITGIMYSPCVGQRDFSGIIVFPGK
jgi:hypothetical protein